MDLGIKGKVAVVCGASAGMGKATALSLAKEGVKVALCARNPGNLEAAAVQIRKATGAEVFFQTADVTDSKAVEEFLEETHHRLGCPDILV
ncbi:MAG: SDR family NAD(P)-dependent oxidoreductase, partial [Acidobacteria bacterium]|nr:SDR family NAD(P)-dependent oxidoreductase [Acidobacteriota bacterium]